MSCLAHYYNHDYSVGGTMVFATAYSYTHTSGLIITTIRKNIIMVIGGQLWQARGSTNKTIIYLFMKCSPSM
jgi:hypothetical protein